MSNFINEQVGTNVKGIDFSQIKGKFCLVIKGADENLCNGLGVILQSELKRILGIYNFDLIVMNDMAAKEYKLMKESD